jgi:hypothetical protein
LLGLYSGSCCRAARDDPRVNIKVRTSLPTLFHRLCALRDYYVTDAFALGDLEAGEGGEEHIRTDRHGYTPSYILSVPLSVHDNTLQATG